MDDNIHNLRDALEWLDRRIREEAELDGEMTNDHAIQLGFITNMLKKFPLRQCDVGTAEEQAERFEEFCDSWQESGPDGGCSGECPCMELRRNEYGGCFGRSRCFAYWAQMPYEAEEGAGE